MKLLVVTQAVDEDNSVLAFFHEWIKEFAKNCEQVTVICLQKGRYELPSNVKVVSLGKGRDFLDHGKFPAGNFPSPRKFSGENFLRMVSKITSFAKLCYVINFYRFIFRERKNYDAVFVHMNPIYVVLGGILWKSWGKPVGMWYTHRNVDLKLKVAEKLSNAVFTASKESFSLPSKKVVIVGHGIDVARFANVKRAKELGIEPIRIISVGRITAIKNCDVLVEAARILKDKWQKQFEVFLIGAAVTTEDQSYEHKIKNLIDAYDLENIVKLTGNISAEEMPLHYSMADASVNLTPTGGVDKAVLESMAAGVPVFSSNKTFTDYFGSYAEDLIFQEKNAVDLADKIMKLFSGNQLAELSESEKKTARERADVSALILMVVTQMSLLRSSQTPSSPRLRRTSRSYAGQADVVKK